MAENVPLTREQFYAQKYNGTPPYRADMSRANVMEQSRQPTNYAGFVGQMLPNLFNGGNTGQTPGQPGQKPTAGGNDWLSNALGLGGAASVAAPAASATPTAVAGGINAASSMPALGAAMGQGTTAAQAATPFTWVGGVPTQVGATAPATGGMTAMGAANIAGPAAIIGNGLYQGYDMYKNRDKWDDQDEWKRGAWQGFKGAGVVGGIAGALASKFGGGKHKDQRGRDEFRKTMKDGGMLSDGYNLNLADGNKYDIGQDGSVKNYNVDFSREGIGDVVGSVNPLAYIIAGGDEKKATDLAGYYANAASSSGGANANALKFYQDAGIDRNQAWERIDQMVQEGKIDSGKGDAFKAGIDKLHGVR